MQINTEGQSIVNVEIEKEVKRSYIDYAMSVIVGRALPDVRDGLKPVHRRILYSMYEENLTHDKPFRKSATTVGYVLGHYHPHGDAAVYDTMVRMAQPFSLRYPLIEGHGNFGNIDGDGAAAYRYTEARMARLSNEMLTDIEKEVVDFGPNFDNNSKEPLVLPSRFPNLLVNGSIGIAVGMATNIPPHNLGEVIDGAIYLMENPDCEIIDLCRFIKGPDFPTAATIYGTNGIYAAYKTGRGKVLVRAKSHFEEKNGRVSIIFTEIPYQVNKSALIMSIADLVKDKRIEGISDIRDESGRDGMRIVIDLKRDANREIVLNLLYKYSQLQDTFAVNMLALVDNQPKTLNLKQMLEYYIAHQEDVVKRKTSFELDKAKARLHILEGYERALDMIEEVIALIRSCRTVAEAKTKLVESLDFSEVQAQSIVEMPLGRLAGLEIEKILEEKKEKEELCRKLIEILGDEKLVLDIIKNDLLEIKRKYGDERRTVITENCDEIMLEDLIEKHKCIITISNTGYIKRIPADVYQAQNRGGKGVTAMTTKEEDYVSDMFVAHSHNYLLMFSNFGKVYIKKCYELPEASRTAKGTNIVNILNLSQNEKITAFVAAPKLNCEDFLTMITRSGKIKRCKLSNFRHIRRDGIKAITLEENDELLYVHKTDGNYCVLIATSEGNGVKFDENKIRVMGRTASGVRGIKLPENAVVIGAAVVRKDDESKSLLTITENGFGKRTELYKFPERNRGGKGIICHKLNEKTGSLAAIAAVDEDSDILLITDSGMLIRTKVNQISVTGRNASGVIVMRLNGESKIMNFQILVNDEKISEEANKVSDEVEQDDDVILDEEKAEEDDTYEDGSDEEDETDEEEDEEEDEE